MKYFNCGGVPVLNTDSQGLVTLLAVVAGAVILTGYFFAHLSVKQRAIKVKKKPENDHRDVLDHPAFLSAVTNVLDKALPDTRHAIVMLEIENIKPINKKIGFDAGDRVVSDSIEQVRLALRSSDIMGMISGDKFMICFIDIPFDAVIKKRTSQICAMLKRDYEGIGVSASAGIAIFPRDGRRIEELERNAYKALSCAKEFHDGRFFFYSADMENSACEKTSSQKAQPQLHEIKRTMLAVTVNEPLYSLLHDSFNDKFTIDRVTSGIAAFNKLRNQGLTRYDVVICDYGLLDRDMKMISAASKDAAAASIPIIVTGEAKYCSEAVNTGIADYIILPTDSVTLARRVKVAIEKAAAEKLWMQKNYIMSQGNEELRYRTVIDSTGTIIAEYDLISGNFVFDESMSKFINKNCEGRTLWDILSTDCGADKRDAAKLESLLSELIHKSSTGRAEYRLRLKISEKTFHWFRCRMYRQNEKFRLASELIITFNDINEEVCAEDKLKFQAEHDELTGIYNRAAFIRKAGGMIQGSAPGTWVISVVDINNFKVLNDMFGHAEGDRLLCSIADTLQKIADCVGGICGRLNADYFAIIEPHTQETFITAKKITEAAPKYPLDAEIASCTGRCVIDDSSVSVESWIDRSQLAQQTIKGKYGAKAAWYNEDLRRDLLRKNVIIRNMSHALSDGQFEMYLQPQYDLKTSQIIGAESLSRWKEPDGNMIMPGEFIPIFEKSGFIMKLDTYMWEKACARLRQWLDRYGNDFPLKLSVNVSRVNINNSNLFNTITGLAEKYKIPKSRLELEITESAYTGNAHKLIELTQELHSAGFPILMDDFGSGYSSLNILKYIPVDVLKLDMKFLGSDDAESLIRSKKILTATVNMAHDIGISTIAEGVETEENADFLRSIGCEMAQGYLFAKPMSEADFEKRYVPLVQSQLLP